MAAMDIDSAKGKHQLGAAGGRDARRKSPRGTNGPDRSSPNTVAKAKQKAHEKGDPERRVLFAEGDVMNNDNDAVEDSEYEDSEDEQEAIMPTQTAPKTDLNRDEETADDAIQKDDATTPAGKRTSFGGFARTVASGLGAVGLGAVAKGLGAVVSRQRDLEDSARKGDDKDSEMETEKIGTKTAEWPPTSPLQGLASRLVNGLGGSPREELIGSPSPAGKRSPKKSEEDDEEEKEILAEAKVIFFKKVFDETSVVLHDNWVVKFEWSTSGADRRRRKRFFSPEGNKFSDATKVIQMMAKQRERGDEDKPILVSQPGAVPSELTGTRLKSPVKSPKPTNESDASRRASLATTTALAQTPMRTPKRAVAVAQEAGPSGAPLAIPQSAPPTTKPKPSPVGLDMGVQTMDPQRNLDALRRKIRAKLNHDLEDGWRCEWETIVRNGRELSEKVWRDPLAPGKRLAGDAQAMTHVKMRLAAATVQRRAAAEAATKMAADAKQAEEKANQNIKRIGELVAKISDPEKQLALGVEMEAARADLAEKREWCVFAHAEADVARKKIQNPNLQSPKRAFGVGGTPMGNGTKAHHQYRNLSHGGFQVPALPSASVKTTPGARGLALTNPRSTPSASGAALSLSMFTPADREEEARRQLVERVYAETGVRLGPEWRVKLSVHSNGKEGNIADRAYKRFFSPGGKRFESAGAIVAHVLDFKKRAMSVEGEAAKSPEQLEEERVEDEEFSKQEAAARRELIKQVFEETGVMLGANWRVSMERSWSTTKRKMVGRMRFFAPDAKKFSSKADVVEHVERQVRSGKLKRHSAPSRPRSQAAPISAKLLRNQTDLNERDREEEAAAELAERAKEATGVDLSPGWRVRWVKEEGGKVYKRFFDPKGKRYSNLGAAIRQVKRDNGIESPGEDEKDVTKRRDRRDNGARNLLFAMDRCADDEDEDAMDAEPTRKGSRRIAANQAMAEQKAAEESAAAENAKRPSRKAEKEKAVKAALLEQEKAEKAAEKARKAMAAAEKALRRAEKAGAVAAARDARDAEKEKAQKARTLALPAPSVSTVTPAALAEGAGNKRRKQTPPMGDYLSLTTTAARNMSAVERESLNQVALRVQTELNVELNKGWTVSIVQRKSGVTVGANDKYFIPPAQPSDAPEWFRTKSKYRSEGEVVEYARRLNGLGSSKKRKRDKPGKDKGTEKSGKENPKKSRSGSRKPKSVAIAEKGSKKTVSTAITVSKHTNVKTTTTVSTKRRKQTTVNQTGVGVADDETVGLGVDSDKEDEDVWGVVESEDDESGSESSGSESEDDSSESEDDVSDSEEEEAGDGNDDSVRVEGMLTVVDASAKRQAFEQRVLTPAKVRELEQHIENQLANPAMGFDVDVLQLEYQRVTGFEALSEDAMELREMLQQVVQREKEKALAAAGGGLFSPDTRAAVQAAEKTRVVETQIKNDDVAFPEDEDEDEVNDVVKGKDVDVSDEGDDFAAAADVAVATTIKAMRRVSGQGAAVHKSKKNVNVENEGNQRGGPRVARTLGNVGVKRKSEEIMDEGDDSEEEEQLKEELDKSDDADTDELSPNSSQEEIIVQKTAHQVSNTRWNASDLQMISQAKSVLHTSTAPSEVMCRESERTQVLDLMRKSLKTNRGGSVYVCGLPGTGKSLTVSEAEKVARVWGDGSKNGGGNKYHVKHKSDRVKVASVNCMALGDPRLVFAKVIEELGGVAPMRSDKDRSDKDDANANVDLGADLGQLPEVTALRQLVCGDTSGSNSAGSSKASPPTVILLDEMDTLVSKAQGILYELFGLPTLLGSKCLVIGVANGINLVESSLPRLAARGCEPTVVRFNAYDKTQIKSLLRQRLGSLPFTVFEDAGLELCSRKVAAATGDMRRALNICAVAVDLCAREAAEATEGNSATGTVTNSSVSLVKIAHMARAISASFSSPVVDTMRGLPQHQQMVLCAAVRLFREKSKSSSSSSNSNTREATLGVLNDRYTALCKEACIRGLTPGEFSGVVTVLADQTLLKVGSGREDRQRKVSLAVHQDDVVFALQGVNFFRKLIGEGRGKTGGGSRRGVKAHKG